MEPQDRVKKYAESLDKSIENTWYDLKKTMEDFREKCLLVSPERNVPRDVVIELREIYKEIRERLTETKAIQQLLKGKYRQYVRANPTRDKELTELGFLAKTCYSKFEYTLLQIQAKERAKLKGVRKEREHPPKASEQPPFQWFQSNENEAMFLQEVEMMKDLGQEAPSPVANGERREIPKEAAAGGLNLTLFVIKGDPLALDALQAQIQLREQDILERYNKEELRGVLSHLREIDPSEIENILRRSMKSDHFSNLKCLLVRIQSQEVLIPTLLERVEKTLGEMAGGETRSLSV
jgi:hypothetical protein